MATKDELLDLIKKEAIIGVVREETFETAEGVARAYADNGIRVIEITLTTPDAVELISQLAALYNPIGVEIAAGSIRSRQQATEVHGAGASILVSPHTDSSVISYAMDNDLLCIAGAATPTEMINAWEAGASIIKVYPARLLGGPAFIRTIRQPIRDLLMLAGGPVEIDEIQPYLSAGAIAVNMAASLAPPDLVAAGNWGEIGERIAEARHVVDDWQNGA